MQQTAAGVLCLGYYATMDIGLNRKYYIILFAQYRILVCRPLAKANYRIN